jgi:hypothetical protein
MARDDKKDGNGGAETDTRKRPHELMLEWAQTGLMEVPVRLDNGYFGKDYIILSMSKRLHLAKACASFYAPKLVAQVQPNRNKQAAEPKRETDGHNGHISRLVEDLVLPYGQSNPSASPPKSKGRREA